MTERRDFTKAVAERLGPLPVKARRWVYDTKTRGLCMLITPSGAKSWYLYRKMGGRPERIRLGAFPDLPVSRARRMADRINGAVAEGKNPADARRRQRQSMTLGGLFAYYLEQHARPHKSPRSVGEDQAQFNRYLRPWRNRRITTIRHRDVAEMHVKLGQEHGHYAANRLRSLLHKMFAVAIEAGLHDGPNPVAGVKRFAEKARGRYLTADELKRLFAALAAEPQQVARDYIALSLFVGARKMNVLGMRWSEIDLDRAMWTIPAIKGGESLTVPLSAPALAVLANRARHNGNSQWVFPSTKSKSGHLQDPTIIWKRVLERANLKGVRLHDLRRTAATWLALSGASLQETAKALGHRSTAVTERHYSKLTLDPVRRAMEAAGAKMLEATGGLPAEIERGAEHGEG